MRYASYIFILLCFGQYSCSENAHPISKKQLDKMRQDSIMAVRDSIRIADSIAHENDRLSLLKNIDEPDLRKTKSEKYRYFYSCVWQPSFVFRVDVDSGRNATLHTKCLAYLRSPGLASDMFSYYGKVIPITKDTVLAYTVQKLTTHEFQLFIEIIEGSYYWVLNDPCPYGTGYTDGDGMSLESVTEHCMDDSMTYHIVGMHMPKKGSFKNGCKYLASVSLLTKNDKVLHENLNQR